MGRSLDEVMCVGLGDDFKQVALNVAFHTCVRGENRVSEKYNCIRINTLDREIRNSAETVVFFEPFLFIFGSLEGFRRI